MPTHRVVCSRAGGSGQGLGIRHHALVVAAHAFRAAHGDVFGEALDGFARGDPGIPQYLLELLELAVGVSRPQAGRLEAGRHDQGLVRQVHESLGDQAGSSRHPGQ
jgi:hypothetical protein